MEIEWNRFTWIEFYKVMSRKIKSMWMSKNILVRFVFQNRNQESIFIKINDV